MKQSQKQVWNKIAPEWFEFKTKPSHNVLNFLSRQKGKILDLGGGAGRHLVKIKNGKMYFVDFSEEMIKFAKKKAKQKNIDAEFFIADIVKQKLPFENNFFDAGICISALHCIKGQKKREHVIKELYRVLKPKAEANISVWNKESGRFKNKNKEDYIRWRDKGKRYYYFYSKNELKKEVEKSGFKIKEKPHSNVSIIFIVEKP